MLITNVQKISENVSEAAEMADLRHFQDT